MGATKSRQPAARHAGDEPGGDEVRLPPERAFLLQLTEGSAPSRDAFAGRLEHLSSGARRRFETWQTFQTAVADLLRKRR